MNERAFILILMLTLILGLGAGVLCSSIPNRGYLNFISLTIVKISLLLLLFSVGLRYSLNPKILMNIKNTIKSGLILPLFSLLASILSGIVINLLVGLDARLSIAISVAMGWYSFIAPYVTNVAGVVYGILAFLSNLLREVFTIIIYPFIPRNIKGNAIMIGGATTMDSTLPVIVKYGGEDLGLIAIYHGSVITLIVPVLVPLIYS